MVEGRAAEGEEGKNFRSVDDEERDFLKRCHPTSVLERITCEGEVTHLRRLQYVLMVATHCPSILDIPYQTGS